MNALIAQKHIKRVQYFFKLNSTVLPYEGIEEAEHVCITFTNGEFSSAKYPTSFLHERVQLIVVREVEAMISSIEIDIQEGRGI